MARVAIVIVTFYSGEHIGACLDSLADEPDCEIVVVDNASGDHTRDVVARRPSVRLIANATNVGFAAAVNQGVQVTEAPLVLLLNPDTRGIQEVESLVGEFATPGVGAAGGLLLDESGRPQSGFMYRRLPTPAALILEVLGVNRLWPGNPVNWAYRCLGDDPVIPCLVEQPAGAFLMFSRRAWREIGGFDERFRPVWFEDVDFCNRLLQAGYSVHFNPIASAIHTGAHSIDSLDMEKRERYWYGSLLEYAAKHYHSFTYRMVCIAVVLGAVFRLLWNVPRSGLKSFAVYGAVCRLAGFRLFQPRRNSAVSVR